MNIEDLNSELKNLAKDISILYVEDNELARAKTSNILKRYFHNVDVAEDGVEALGLFMSKKHDLILSDISMPKMNGLELVKSIKGVNAFQRVILFSAYTEIKYLVSAIELGVDGFIFKPMEFESFFTVLHKSCLQISNTKQNRDYKDNLEELVKKRTHDLEQRNKALKAMVHEIKKSSHLKEEMKIAQKVQENFLPNTLPDSKRLEFASFFQAAQFIGGDYYDCFYSQDKAINIVIADVSGHGVGPAITMSTFRGFCQSILSNSQDFQTQVEKINELICKDSQKGEFFITSFFVKFYEDKDEISYISAGHNDMLLYENQKENFCKIKSTSLPLGVFPSVKYEVKTQKINKDDFLFLYTDGLTEATNKNKEIFSLERLEKLILKLENKNISNILEHITSHLQSFTKGQENSDDTTIFICKFN